jgi:hypothetical protein
MIVRTESDGSLVMITQNDHAKAAGFFAAHWGNSRFERPRPFESATRAACLHDLVWLAEEAAPRFDPQTGRTPNFLEVPSETQLDAQLWADDWVYAQDRYAGILASKHRTGIWKSRYGLIKQPQYPARALRPEVEAFVARSEARQQAAASGLDAHELTVNYILLQVWDFLSLYICTTEFLAERSYEPVPTTYAGGPGVSMRLAPATDARIALDPYPFDRPSLEVNVVYRRLPRSTFENAAVFNAAFFDAAPQIETFTFFDPAAALR